MSASTVIGVHQQLPSPPQSQTATKMPPKASAGTNGSPQGGGGQQIDLATLSAQQLMQVKKQLDEELEHLNGSFNQLRGAQARFGECVRSIDAGVAGVEQGAHILVPLTTSLYVPGTLADKEKVIVDVGTGFYVEKSTADATKFYTEKTKELGASLKDLESILTGKASNLRVVEDVLRQKVVQGQAPPANAN